MMDLPTAVRGVREAKRQLEEARSRDTHTIDERERLLRTIELREATLGRTYLNHLDAVEEEA